MTADMRSWKIVRCCSVTNQAKLSAMFTPTTGMRQSEVSLYSPRPVPSQPGAADPTLVSESAMWMAWLVIAGCAPDLRQRNA